MSTQNPYGRVGAAFPSLPRGDVLGTFETYPEAQQVVAKLAASDFPVGKLSIVGNDLKTVERVTGKLTYGRAAIAGALSGLWLGIFFGIVLTLFSGGNITVIIAAAIIGAAFGMLYGVVSFSVTKRQRDFTSIHQVLATNYQIIVDPQLTGQARQILGLTPAGWQAPANPVQHGAPDQSPYGSAHQQFAPQADAHPSQTASRPESPAQPPRYGTNDGPRYGEQVPSEAAEPTREDDRPQP